MEKFRGVDYYGIDALLSEDERMVRDAIRDWVEAEYLPIVTEHHRQGTFPVALLPKLGELGVFGATLKGYGCAGLNNVAYGLIMQELERGDSGLRSAASVQSALVMYPIHAYGSDVSCQDCRIPVVNRLPGVKGLKGPLSCLSQARYGIAWGAVGAAMACYDWALQYAQQRVQFGRPIASFQLVQQKLVWIVTEITKAQLLCLQLGRLKDEGKARAQQISMAKMNNVQIALDTARMARDILGAAGIVDEHPVIRHLMNLETVNTYEG